MFKIGQYFITEQQNANLIHISWDILYHLLHISLMYSVKWKTFLGLLESLRLLAIDRNLVFDDRFNYLWPAGEQHFENKWAINSFRHVSSQMSIRQNHLKQWLTAIWSTSHEIWFVFWRVLLWLNTECFQPLNIEAETRWTTFSRRHFQMHFLEWNCLNFD